MKKLFLTSSFSDSYQQLESFFGDTLSGKSVAFFDTASEVEEYTEFKDEALAILKEFKTKVTLIDLKSKNLKEQITKTDIIFVAGGNTFYLLQELRTSGADLLITEHIKAGKPYIGESAGSIIMSPDIEYIKYMDEPDKAPNLSNTKGLNLIDVYPLPHIDNEYLDEFAQRILKEYKNKLPLHPLTDKAFLLIKE